jgi:hypothetical protein
LTLVVFAALNGLSSSQSAERKTQAQALHARSSLERGVLSRWKARGPMAKTNRVTDLKGMLLYTRDGHMSVQLMYPKSASELTNDYVKNGYEGSFGSYEVNEQACTVTHHVQGSITEGLVGKDLPRAFQFSDSRLIIKSTRPDEHWSVTWEHY